MAQRQHPGSCKSVRTTGKEVKATGKKPEESAVQYIGEAEPGDSGLCLASTTMFLTGWTEVVVLGVDALEVTQNQ